MPNVFAGLPATDEDVAREAVGDYATLAPKCEVLTEGSDGAFTSSSWDLTSASNDFAAQGIQAGHVVVLESRVGTVGSQTRTIPMGKQVLGVSSTPSTACTLHRLGYDTGIGRSPGAPSGFSSITFKVPSVLTHIKDEAVEVRRMLAIAPAIDLSTLPDLRKFTALRVLRALYFQEYRQTAEDTWKDKMGILDAQLAALFSDLMDVYGDETSPNRVLIVGDMKPIEPWCNPHLRWDRRGPFGYPPFFG